MKKICFVLFFIILSTSVVIAKDNNYGFRGPLNFFQSKALEKIIVNEVKKVVGGNIKAEISSYGAKALRNGFFKSARVKGSLLEFEGITVSEFVAQTTSEKNQLDIKSFESPKLLTDIQAEYRAKVTNSDIKSILASRFAQKEIENLNFKLAPFAQVKDVDVFCENSRLNFRVNMVSGLFGAKLSFSGFANISSNSGVTEFRDIKLSNNIRIGSVDEVVYVLNGLNPVNIIINELENATLNLDVKEIKIIDDKIEISGIINVYRGG